MKYDQQPTASSTSSTSEKPKRVVFGSTRPGDEIHILKSIRELWDRFPDWQFVIAPRHPDRFKEVEQLIGKTEYDYSLHSALPFVIGEGCPRLLLVDQLGVLNDYYAESALAFVGGSFKREHGGQNILEPSFHSIPVVFGPHTQNFSEEARLLLAGGGGVALQGPEELTETLEQFLHHPEKRRQVGCAAVETVSQHRGAVQRNLEIIESYLAKTS